MRSIILSATVAAVVLVAGLFNAPTNTFASSTKDAPVAKASEKAAEAPQYSRRTPLVEAYQKVADGVVALNVVKDGEWGAKNISGTGIIVDERGFVVTNHHVAADANKITATLADGTKVPARVHYVDVTHDLAIIRLVTTKKLKALSFGPSSDLMRCETVLVVGNPYGYEQTVTTGIVAGLNREITMPSGEKLKGIIQTSAAINPGNSGGPVININGQVVGVVVALRDGAQCLAFALPSDTVKKWLCKQLAADKVSKVSHGLTTREKVAAETGKDRNKLIVDAVEREGSRYSVRKGDVIVKIGSVNVRNAFDLERAVWGHKAGEQLKVSVIRDGKVVPVIMKLAASGETRTASR
jgi:serine protease Do